MRQVPPARRGTHHRGLRLGQRRCRPHVRRRGPGKNEDLKGHPFVGQAGKLLDQLLEEVGLERADVFVNNTLNCRPPGNRDPHPVEIENCQDYLMRKIELVEPKVICTLGNFATKLLRGDNTGITKVHGQAEVRVIGRRAVRLLPIFHPAAALYTRSMLDTLRADMAKVPELLALPVPEQPEPDDPPRPPISEEPETSRAVPSGGEEGEGRDRLPARPRTSSWACSDLSAAGPRAGSTAEFLEPPLVRPGGWSAGSRPAEAVRREVTLACSCRCSFADGDGSGRDGGLELCVAGAIERHPAIDVLEFHGLAEAGIAGVHAEEQAAELLVGFAAVVEHTEAAVMEGR